MQIKTPDGERNVASNGVGVGGLTTGIIGTAGWLLNGGLGNILGGRTAGVVGTECHDTREIATLQAELAKEKAERYADAIGIASFKEAAAADEKLANRIAVLENFAHEIDKKVAVEGQATNDNFRFLNYKIDNTKDEVLCYVNSKFVAGKLVMPKDSICPEVMERYNTWEAPTTPAAGG